MIFLVAALHEQIVRNPPDRTRRQVDHIVGRLALRVVETIVVDVDRDRARLQIMTAAALFEARTRDRAAAVAAGGGAVRAAPRPEERRVGHERGSPWRPRRAPDHSRQKTDTI